MKKKKGKPVHEIKVLQQQQQLVSSFQLRLGRKELKIV